MKNHILTITLFLISVVSYGQSTPAAPPTVSKLAFQCTGKNIRLKVIDLDKSEKYYTEVVGLTPLPMPENFRPVVRWLKISEGCELHLSAGRVSFVNSNYLQVKHLSLKTPKGNGQKLKNNVSFAKGSLTKEIVNATGLATIYLNDPDGYVIEVIESN